MVAFSLLFMIEKSSEAIDQILNAHMPFNNDSSLQAAVLQVHATTTIIIVSLQGVLRKIKYGKFSMLGQPEGN